MRAISFPVCLATGLITALVLSYVSVLGLSSLVLRHQLAAEDTRTYQQIADTLRGTVIAQLTGDISLEQLQLGGLLGQYCQFDKNILDISILSPRRVVTVDTDPWRVGMMAPGNWLPRDVGQTDWQDASESIGRLGVSLRDPRGNPHGILVLRYTPNNMPVINAALLRLTQLGLSALGLAALLTVVAVTLPARRLRRDMNGAAAALMAKGTPTQALAQIQEFRPLLLAAGTITQRIEDSLREIAQIGAGEDGKAG